MCKPAFYLDTAAEDFAADFESLTDCKRQSESHVRGDVERIISDIRTKGVAALIEETTRLDGWTPGPETLRVTDADIHKAVEACPPETLRALKRAAERIAHFHKRQFEGLKPDRYLDEDGVLLGSHWTAIDAVGLYVPGGLAAYPTSVLMNAIPARVAGAVRVAMTVPTPKGEMNPLVLVAAHIAGVSEIWKIGGAQAIASLAYGCVFKDKDFNRPDSVLIPHVDKIVGPGNAWVAEAKRQVFGQVGIDMIAGPSEVCIVADSATPPEWTAWDLLAQAEHDPSAQSVLITADADYGAAVCQAVNEALKTHSRSDIAAESWKTFGAVIICQTLSEAPRLINLLAPEHLQLSVSEAEELFASVRHAGAVFLGRYTPEAVGDYLAGPNHVLPTSRSARFSSGLNVLDFMKRTTCVSTDAQALARLADNIATLADAEGLQAHGKSVTIRMTPRS